MDIKFRENWNRRTVDVYVNGEIVSAHREYRGAVEWAKAKYNLTDPQLIAIYRDYKSDYDLEE